MVMLGKCQGNGAHVIVSIYILLYKYGLMEASTRSRDCVVLKTEGLMYTYRSKGLMYENIRVDVHMLT